MTYLLINHAPLARGGSRAAVRVGAAWLAELRAHARAVREAGGRLTLAAPLIHADESFEGESVVPDAEGFEFVPLPRYATARQFAAVRGELRRTLARAIRPADVVQMGYGGHPVPLGRVAWPIAGRLGKRRIWSFGDADPFPRLLLEAANAAGPITRLVRRRRVDRLESFCRKAVRQADLVFAHSPALAERFAGAWGPHCHLFERSTVTDAEILTDREWAARQAMLRDANRPLRLVTAGRQTAVAGTDHIIRAVAKCQRLSVPVELDVMGEGADLEVFKQAAAEENIAGAVRFLGTVPAGDATFQAWIDRDALVVATLAAEVSRVAVSAAARGLAVVAYRNGGTDRLLAGAAVPVPRGEVDALADALLRLHQNRYRLEELGAKGLRLARSMTLDAAHRRRANLAAGLLKAENHAPEIAAKLSVA